MRIYIYPRLKILQMRILILRNLFFPGCPTLCAMPFLPPTQHAKQNCLQLQRKRQRADFKQPAAARNGQTFRHKFKTDYKCKLGFKKSGNLKSSYSQPRKYAPSLRICRTRSHRKSNIPAEALNLQAPLVAAYILRRSPFAVFVPALAD